MTHTTTHAEILTRRSAVNGEPTGLLRTGEMAYSYLPDGTGAGTSTGNGGDRLYIGVGGDVEVAGDLISAGINIIGGKYYTDLLNHPHGTLTAGAALIAGADGFIDNINVSTALQVNGTLTVDGLSDLFSAIIDSASIRALAVQELLVDSATVNSDLTVSGTSNLSVANINGTLTVVGLTDLSTATIDSADIQTLAVQTLLVDSATVNGDLAVLGVTELVAAAIDSASITSLAVQSLLGDSATINGTLTVIGLSDLATASIDSADIQTLAVQTLLSDSATINGTLTVLGVSDLFAATIDSASITALAVQELLVDSATVNGDLTVSGTSSLSEVDVSQNLLVDGNLDVGGTTNLVDLILAGNLTVQGTTTTINSTNVTINDKVLILADSAATPLEADSSGIAIAGSNASILYKYLGDKWVTNKDLDVTGNLYINGIQFEQLVDSEVNNLLVEGEGIDLEYNDGAGTLTISAEFADSDNAGVASFGAWADSAETLKQFAVDAVGSVTIKYIDCGSYGT
jgi:hypothetical protein